jgi:N-formylglutamate amidohydrolase
MTTKAFDIRPPAAGTHVPLVVDSPHSGTAYPADFDAAVPLARLREGEDTFVDELYADAPAAGATLIAARFPRVYVDPNRSLLDIDASLLSSPWPGPAIPSRKTELGIGLIWRLLDTGEAIYARKLTVDEVRRRIVEYHQPYQRAVKNALDEAHRHFGAVWHLNVHSMPAVSSKISEEGPGKSRPDFVLGDRDGTTCDGAFTQFVARTLEDMGYVVQLNDPYKGVELVRAFSDPAAGRHSLQVEVNRRLYMDERTREKATGFDTLRAGLARLVQAVAQYAARHVPEDHHHRHHDHAHHDHDHHHGHEGHGHRHDHEH